MIGVDCACNPAKLGLAFVEYDEDGARLVDVQVGSKRSPPEAIFSGWLEDSEEPALLALDAPFGTSTACSTADLIRGQIRD